jgi:hypothetical protein
MIGIDGTVAAGRHVHLFQNINAIIPASDILHRSTSSLCATATIIISRGRQRIAACWVIPQFLDMTWIATGRRIGRTPVPGMKGAGTSSSLTREIKQVRGNLTTQSRQAIEHRTNNTAAHRRCPSEEKPRVFPDRHPARQRRLRAARTCLSRGAKGRLHLSWNPPARSTRLRNNGGLHKSTRVLDRRLRSSQVLDRRLRSSQVLDRRLRSSQVPDRRLRSSQTNRDGMFSPPGRKRHHQCARPTWIVGYTSYDVCGYT